MASANAYITAQGSGTSNYTGYTSQIYCGYGMGTGAYKARLTLPSLYSYKNSGISSLLLSVTNVYTSSTTYSTGAQAARFVIDPSSNAFDINFNDSCTRATGNGGFYTDSITSTTPGTVTIDGAARKRYTFDLTAYATQLAAINGTTYCKMWDNQGSGADTMPHVYYGSSASVALARPQLIITYSDMKTIKYGVNGSWVKCQVYYGVNGVWVPCEVYYGTGGQWKAINNT